MPKGPLAHRKASPNNLRKPVRASKAKSVLERAPVLGWRTSDEDEIALRRWRGRAEILDVAAIEPDQGFFGVFRARSASGGSYDVEIRNLNGFTNSCGCIDYRVNGLGSCKHIEGVLAALKRGKARALRAAAKAGSPRIELFLGSARRRDADHRLAVDRWRGGVRPRPRVAPALAPERWNADA